MTFIAGSPDAIECRVRMLRRIMTELIEVISTTDKAQVKRRGINTVNSLPASTCTVVG